MLIGSRILNAVYQGIFDDRLQNMLDGGIAVYFIRDGNLIFHPASVPELVNN